MKKYFEGIDFTKFWKDDEYYAEKCTGETLTDEMVSEAEARLGYKLPKSYIELMKTRNGGKAVRSVWLDWDLEGQDEYEVCLEMFYSIGDEKMNSLFGRFSNEFWFTEWEYPRDVGVIIADTISGGHEMIYLDYRECGKDGEPKVSVCYQESDYKIVKLANSFEEFILHLISEEELEEF